MKLILVFIVSIVISTIKSISKEQNYFEGVIEYKVKTTILSNGHFELSEKTTDSLQKEVDNGNMEGVPTKILFYSNKNGDYRVEHYNNKFINYFIYKSLINKFYTYSQDSVLLETAGDENRFNINKNKKPDIQTIDTNLQFNNNNCKIVKLRWENGNLIEYVFSPTHFKVNPNYYINNNSNNFYNYIEIAKSLPIIIKLHEPNLMSSEQILSSYKEYNVDESLFEINYLKVKKMNEILGDLHFNADDNKDLDDLVDLMISKNNNEKNDSLQNDDGSESELTIDEFKIIENAILKLNIELTKGYDDWKITKEHLDKCRLLLENWYKDRVTKKEDRVLSEGDEKLLIILLERLSEILTEQTEE